MKVFYPYLKKINYGYRYLLTLITGTEFQPTVFHPQFHIGRLMKQHLKEVGPFIDREGVLLDVGCGNQPYRDLFCHRIRTYLGVDMPQHRKFEPFVTRKGYRPDIISNVLKLPIQNNTIDIVLCTQVLEHVSEPSELLKNLNHVLKYKKYVILTCPQSYPIHDREHDYFRFTSHGLRYLFKKNGFEIIEIKRHGGYWIYMALMWNVYVNINLFREGENDLAYRLPMSILKVIFTPFLLISNVLFNLSAWGLDKIDMDQNFTHNYTVIGRKISSV